MYTKEFHIILGVWEFGSILFWDFLEYLGYANYQSVCVGVRAWSTNPVYSYSVLIYMYYALYTAIYMQPVSSSVCVASMLCHGVAESTASL